MVHVPIISDFYDNLESSPEKIISGPHTPSKRIKMSNQSSEVLDMSDTKVEWMRNNEQNST